MRMAFLAGLMALAAGTAGLSTSSPAFADEITVETAKGPVTLASEPGKVAAFDIAAIDTLDALGVPLAGVPDRLYVGYLDAVAKRAQVVGTLFQPDLESLAVLAPDLVILGGRSSPQADAVAQLAPVIDMSISGDAVVAQAKARIASYGALFGKTDAATALTAEIGTLLDQARSLAQGKGDALIVLTNGAKISAYGTGSRFGWLHQELDLPQAAAGLEAGPHGQAISFEFIAETDPDWIFVVDRGAAIGQDGAAAMATLDNPLVARTKAAQNGRIVLLDAAALYVAGGGAQALKTTLGEMIAALQD